MNGRRLVGFLAVGLALALGLGATALAGDGSPRHEADLNGFAEVDADTGDFGAGDLNGNGKAEVELKAAAGRVCFELEWEDIAEPIAGHIHEAPVGVNGDIVVDLLADAGKFRHSGGRGEAEGCVKGVDEALVRDILAHPAEYYVNIHTEPFPDGAIRGQLERDEDV